MPKHILMEQLKYFPERIFQVVIAAKIICLSSQSKSLNDMIWLSVRKRLICSATEPIAEIISAPTFYL